MKIAIVGGGFTGLTAGYRLSQEGHQVTIFEKEKVLGGLATGSKFRPNWQWYLESFFHHLFTSDYAARNLITELGLEGKLFWLHPKTSIFYQGKISQFDSPFSVLKFPHLSVPEKIRTGMATVYLKTLSKWRTFEAQKASRKLPKLYGQKAYQILWQPLLKSKFGPFADQVSMAWFWARIKKRSAKLGYIEGGLQILINKLVEKIKEGGGKIHLNHEVKNLNDIFRAPERKKVPEKNEGFLYHYSKKKGRIIVTTPTPTVLKITPNLPRNYKKRLEDLKMIGALNLVLVLKEKFLTDNTYWLNINEPDFPFVAVVEHSNFVNRKHYGNNHLLYVGGYYPQNHPYFKMTKKEILKKFTPFLKKINPKFNPLDTKYSILNTNLHAQPIIPPNYSQTIPSHQTPISNLYLANMHQVYPWDRGINYAIELGEKIAKKVIEKR